MVLEVAWRMMWRIYLATVDDLVVNVVLSNHPSEMSHLMAKPSEGSDQPECPPSLIKVFAVRMKKAWVLSYPLSAQ